MIQLWLDGKRIDSIPMLRETFLSRDEEGKITLCSELLEKTANGFFILWLENCLETRVRGNGLERQQDAAIGILLLEQYRETLLKEAEPASLSAAAKEAVARICDIDVNIVEKSSVKTESWISRQELLKMLEKKDWYQKDARIKRTLENISDARLAINTSSLNRIINNTVRRHQRYFTDLYLLNIDDVFTIRDLDGLYNIRLVGFGNPIVHFSPLLRGEKIDMTKRNIKFEGFQLMPNGVELQNTENRLAEGVLD